MKKYKKEENLKKKNKYKNIINKYKKIKEIKKEIKEIKEIKKKETEKEMLKLIKQEIKRNNKKIKEIKRIIKKIKKRNKNKKEIVTLEIITGVGGVESTNFIADLKKMYEKYIEKKRWIKKIITANIVKGGGYKEVIIRIEGNKIYKNLKYESGVHRVQRLPKTENKGRIHTSTCRVAIYKNIKKTNTDIKESEFKIDTFKSSGAGGQHVNKTNSAIRIKHIPSGIVVECQKERSQHKNKKHALKTILEKIKLKEETLKKNLKKNIKKNLLGKGERVEKIRTYNYKENRLTDHKYNFNLNNLDLIMQGNLEKVIKKIKKNVKKNKKNKKNKK